MSGDAELLTGFDDLNRDSLQRLLHLKHTGRKIAIFDADGTLWRGDIGDHFLSYQIRSGQLSPEQEKLYFETHDQPGRQAECYSWMALWNQGQTEKEMIYSAKDALKTFRGQEFPAQQNLIAQLLNHEFEVWVISASLWWVVASAVESWGIPSHRVLATRSVVENGILGNRMLYPAPYKAGKVDAWKRDIGEKPLLVSGNSMGDFEMLGLAQNIALAVNSAKYGDPYFNTEQDLKRKAMIFREKSPIWCIQSFSK